MSLHAFLSLGLLLIIIVVPSTWAEQIDGLYKVAVPVQSQSSKALRKATREGLRTVFVRVSGNSKVITQHTIAEAINHAQHYTKQFHYERVRPTHPISVNIGRVDGDSLRREKEQLFAVLEFEPALVNQRLREAGLPLWSSNRPTVLVWLVVDDRGKRRFAGVENDLDIVQAITKNALRRGLVLKLPSLDLEDMVAVSPDELWQLNNWRAQAAAERYQADTVLVGRVSHLSNGQWLGSWLYRYDGQRLSFDSDADTIDSYIASGMDQVADLLAAAYAIAPVNIAEGGSLMRLGGISDFTDYARAIAYLEGVSAIHHANVVHIEGDEIIVRLIADGLLSQLEQVFVMDKHLLPAQGSLYQGEYPIVLDYLWPASAGQ
ncbi:MAG: DUF2066 domain-containing protein [Pseudomonadales bacterium]